MAQDREAQMPQPATRRTWMKTAAVMAGTAAAQSVMPARLEAQTGKPTLGDARVMKASARSNIVETTAGKVRGFAANGICAFKGIPYAASTADKQRFMPPAKPTPWTGVRSAMALGPSSPQAYNSTFIGRRAGWNNDEEAFMFDWDDGRPSEDCLRVNVWTPGVGAGRRPVLVWLHGGGYSSGSSNELRMYDGESLSRRGDAVVVSLNHRLGVLGYLNLAEYGERRANAGNAGMLDIVAALDWVKDNIANFGGDPGSVLIFGQSGGGGKVGTLMGMPSAKGLFRRASIQSGSTNVRWPEQDRSGELAAAVLQELGLTRATIDKLQELPYERIVEAGVVAQRKMNPTPAAPGTGGGVNWAPVVDGRVLPEHPWDPKASLLSADVPLLVGTTLNEFANSVQAGDPSLDEMSIDEAKKRVAAQRGDKADQILQSFQQKYPRATPYELFSRISGMTGRQNAVTQAERKAAQRAAPAYLYWFQWQTPILDGRFQQSVIPCASAAGRGERIHLARRAVAPGGPPMERKTAHDFDQELLILFDAYVHGTLDRRGFLDKAAKYAVGGVTAAMLLDQLSPKFLEAQVVNPEDPRIKVQYVEYASPNGYGQARGYLAQPAKTAGKLPAVLVIHENRGLNPHIEDIARRLALDNFVAFAPDALFPLGGYPGDEDTARQFFPKLDQAKTREDFVTAVGWLQARPETHGKVGAVGFCYGGGMVNLLATRVPDLAAGVAFYGSSPDLEDVSRIKAALLIQSAEVDERINASWPAYEAALKAADVRYERHLYPGTQHGFNNDTTPRFDAAAAKLAWERTLAHFNRHLQ